MKKLLFALIASTLIMPVAATSQTPVKGYFKKDGTYVQPHYRSKADGNPYNNYSTKGNYNPYTGAKGTKDPYSSGSYGSSSSNPYSTPCYYNCPD